MLMASGKSTLKVATEIKCGHRTNKAFAIKRKDQFENYK